MAKQYSKKGWDVVYKNRMAKQQSMQEWDVADKNKMAKQYGKRNGFAWAYKFLSEILLFSFTFLYFAFPFFGNPHNI